MLYAHGRFYIRLPFRILVVAFLRFATTIIHCIRPLTSITLYAFYVSMCFSFLSLRRFQMLQSEQQEWRKCKVKTHFRRSMRFVAFPAWIGRSYSSLLFSTIVCVNLVVCCVWRMWFTCRRNNIVTERFPQSRTTFRYCSCVFARWLCWRQALQFMLDNAESVITSNSYYYYCYYYPQRCTQTSKWEASEMRRMRTNSVHLMNLSNEDSC